MNCLVLLCRFVYTQQRLHANKLRLNAIFFRAKLNFKRQQFFAALFQTTVSSEVKASKQLIMILAINWRVFLSNQRQPNRLINREISRVTSVVTSRFHALQRYQQFPRGWIQKWRRRNANNFKILWKKFNSIHRHNGVHQTFKIINFWFVNLMKATKSGDNTSFN